MDDDLFGRTVVQLKPASRVEEPVRQNWQNPAPNARYPKVQFNPAADTNPILGYCIPLVCFATDLKNTARYDDVGQLFSLCANDIKQITEGLRRAGLPDNTVVSARYMLCGFVDEMVLNTPWGANSQWASQSLLSFFHREVNSGIKYFQILDKVIADPSRYVDILEFGYVCLCHGYMGKYRLQPGGSAEVAELKQRLFDAISQVRPASSVALSGVGAAEASSRNPADRKKLAWLTAAGCSMLGMVVFTGFLFDLNGRSDPIAVRASALGINLPQLVKKTRDVAPLAVSPDWRELVAADMAAGRLEVEPTAGGIKFRLLGESLFESGSAELRELDVVNNVSAALASLPGPVRVTGHTDDIPIRTVRFPSNWQLSEARAASVAELLRQAFAQREIEVAGMADSDPIAANDTEQNRAKNRRVEIDVYLR